MVKEERLNGVTHLLDQGGVAFLTFASPDVATAVSLSGSRYDGIVIDTEHSATDIREVRDFMQYLLSRSQIQRSGTLRPSVTPIVRVAANGEEQNHFLAKQALDIGAYGIVWPHISTVEQAYSAVAACRYPRLPSAPHYEPNGLRGDGPAVAARYWGVDSQEYYRRADLWPLDPSGDLLVILQCEDVKGIENLPDILANVPGIGAILIGEGDLSQELGHPRQYDHPEVLDAVEQIASICKRHDVVAGHPHATAQNMERLLGQGFRLLMTAPVTSYAGLEAGLSQVGRQS